MKPILKNVLYDIIQNKNAVMIIDSSDMDYLFEKGDIHLQFSFDFGSKDELDFSTFFHTFKEMNQFLLKNAKGVYAYITGDDFEFEDFNHLTHNACEHIGEDTIIYTNVLLEKRNSIGLDICLFGFDYNEDFIEILHKKYPNKKAIIEKYFQSVRLRKIFK